MADARLPERYLTDRRIVRLSDGNRSSYFMALVWSVSNRTDGRIERADLPLIPTFREHAIGALVDCGLWIAEGPNAWRVEDYERAQTTRAEFEVLDNARKADREKKRRHRAAAKGDSPGASPGHVPGTAEARQRQEQGQDQGEATTGDESDAAERDVEPSTGEVGGATPWSVAPIGRGAVEAPPADDEGRSLFDPSRPYGGPLGDVA